MFRAALLRTARAAAIRPATTQRTLITAAAKPVRVAAMVPRFQAVRMYSAGGALNKEEVEGRIMSLLQGFDKVSFWYLGSKVECERAGGSVSALSSGIIRLSLSRPPG